MRYSVECVSNIGHFQFGWQMIKANHCSSFCITRTKGEISNKVQFACSGVYNASHSAAWVSPYTYRAFHFESLGLRLFCIPLLAWSMLQLKESIKVHSRLGYTHSLTRGYANSRDKQKMRNTAVESCFCQDPALCCWNRIFPPPHLQNKNIPFLY